MVDCLVAGSCLLGLVGGWCRLASVGGRLGVGLWHKNGSNPQPFAQNRPREMGQTKARNGFGPLKILRGHYRLAVNWVNRPPVGGR